MKTLLERLKPEISKNLYESQKEYPNMIGDLIEKLSANVGITSMTLGDLSNLSNFSPNRVITILEIYDMFEEN